MSKYIIEVPALLKEWNYEKNEELGIAPDWIVTGSNKYVWWKCEKGHEWQAKPNNRSHGNGCPFCAGQKVLKGFNDLATIEPKLAEQWDSERNYPITPYEVMIKSNKKVWWKCEKGHSWQAIISNRTRAGSGCPYCSGQKAIIGENDLATMFPELINEWNYNKNGDLSPDSLKYMSSQRVWWKCKDCGYEWETSIKNRTRNGTGCPKCANKAIGESISSRAVNKSGSLVNNNPWLAEEWSERNTLSADRVSTNSNQKAWWKCRVCGYEWQAVIASRNTGVGCPKCAKRTRTSFPEQAIFYYIKSEYPNAINGYQDAFDNKMELDIFIPELSIGIEYDGAAWHKGTNSEKKEKLKYKICQEKGIKLIRIRENASDVPNQIADCEIIIEKGTKSFDGLTKAINELKKVVLLNRPINIETDQYRIRENYYSYIESKSLAACYPELAKQWDYDKNGIITPNMVYAVSGDKVWWKCEKGHEWQASIANRTKGRQCPYCSGKKVLKGFNDLATVAPEVAAEWNYEKNGELSPWSVTAGSNKKVWWKCDKGHEWETTIVSRTSGTNCPYCSNQKVLTGYNDLLTIDPELAKQWDYEKNSHLTPKDVLYRTTRKVWWKCEKGHSWQAQVKSRYLGNGCPECRKEKFKK